MMGTRSGRLASKYRTGMFVVLAAAMVLLLDGPALAAPAANEVPALQITPEVNQLLAESDKAMKAGNVNLALIQVKNAVRLAPKSGEVRVHLGELILYTGEAVAAERELRQALMDGAPRPLAVPLLLRAMLQRNEHRQLLTEFPEPPPTANDDLAATILQARSISLQLSGRGPEARVALDRSLTVRRDTNGLVMSAKLALQQTDIARARNETTEALKLTPKDEEALSFSVLLERQTGDAQKALAKAEEFLRIVPKSAMARVLRIEMMLDLNQDAKAKTEIDALLKEQPNSIYGRYFRGFQLARSKDVKGAWHEIQNLPPEFIQSQPGIALVVAGIAASSGNPETAGAILSAQVTRAPDFREARLQLASIRLAQNSAQAVLDTLAPLKASNDPVVHALLAQAYLRLRKYDDAVASLEIVNSTPQANNVLKLQMVLSQLQVGESDRAIQVLRDMARGEPNNSELTGPLIAALVGSGRWDEALATTDTMARQVPKSPLPPFYRGQIYAAKGNLAEAIAEFGKALTLDPKFQPALYYRADTSLARGNSEDAKKDLQLVLTQNPTNVLTFVKLAQIAINEGKDQDAIALLDRAAKAAPANPTPRLALANYQIAQKRYKEAQTVVDGLLQVSHNDPEGMALQGQLQMLRGQTADAIKTFRTLASTTTTPAAYDMLSKVLYAAKDVAGAEDAAKRAADLAPDSAQIRQNLIAVEIGRGKADDALRTARAYASAYPGSTADVLLANTLLVLKRTNEAEAVLDKSYSSRPNYRVAQGLTELAMSSGNVKKASAVLASWVAKSPNDFAARRDYARVIMATGDMAGARKEYETLLKQHPDDPIVLNNLSYLLEKENPDRALSLATQAAKIAPASPQIADTLGWMKFRKHDSQGALPILQRAHNSDANNSVISYHLALALDANGKRAEAKALLQAALAKDAKFDGSDDARQTLARW